MKKREKIYFIDKSLDKMGGIERVINTLANNLSSKKDVTVISITKNQDQPYFKYNNKIKFLTLVDKQKLLSLKYINKLKLVYYPIRSIEKIIDYFSLRRRIKKIATIFKRNDIIVFGRVEVALQFLPYIKDVKKIIVREAIHLYNHSNLKLLKKLFIEKVDTFIVSSDENKEVYEHFFEGKVKLCKIYNPLGITPSKTDYSLKTIISVGRYDLQKGYDVLIKVWVEVNKAYPDWHLKIMGSGYYQKEMKKLISINKLSDSIELVPNSSDVVSELTKASIFVMPSRIEGYANALVEAMACGLACVSFNWVMGVHDVIDDNRNGIIVPLVSPMKYMQYRYSSKEDIDNLSKAIIKLIANEDLRKQLGKEATKIVDSRTAVRIIDEWEKVVL